MDLSIQKDTLYGIPRLRIEGMLMDHSVFWFSRELKALCGSNAPKVIVELTDTEFVDSHGLGMLVYHHNELSRQGRTLIVLNANKDPDSYIRGLFNTSGLERVLTVAARPEDVI